MNKQEASFLERQTAYTAFSYPDDTELPEIDRDRDIAALERWTRLIFSARTMRLKHMRASVAIAILRGNPNLDAIASHFRVTAERVRQVVNEIQRSQFGGAHE